MSGPSYTGRFAPSPTGPLHFGSLIAAVGSFLEARCRGGGWLVRIEDLDPPREVPGAADRILRQLEAYGLHWDGEVVYQSRREPHYLDALARLRQAGRAYDCGCSRREIAAVGLEGTDGPIYPGTCRGGLPVGREARTVRLLTDDRVVEFRDRVQGPIRQRLDSEVGDFVVRRADGLFAYQLAVVVDDAAQGITEVVRGADLLASTPRQVFIQGLLDLPTPSYLHLPVAVAADGQKLSKQSQAPALPLDDPLPALREALRFLGQPVPITDRLEELWASAIAHWDPQRIPPVRRIDVSPPAVATTALP
jgi:glutamyl-Q tRNA(Asp) synthetase